MKSRFWICVVPIALALVLVATLSARRSSALVEALHTMKDVMDQSTTIAEGVIESVDPKTMMIVTKVNSTLKGKKCPLERIKMNISVGQEWYKEAILYQAKVGEPVIIFYNDAIQSECYTNNFFFQFNGNLDPKGQWAFTHIEIKMNRTFNGPVRDLLQIVKDVLDGKRQPPPPEKTLPPITRQELMGQGAPPGSVSDDADGYEAFPEWHNEEWANATEAASVDYVEPGAPPDPGPQPGLLGEYYNMGGTIPDFPDTKTIKATVRRIDKQIDIANSSGPIAGTDMANNMYVRWTGLLRIEKPGKYKLFAISDDGSRLHIDGKMVVDNGGDHGTIEKPVELDLAKGDHDFKFEFYQNGGPYECRVHWEGQGIPKGPIPPEVFLHKGYIGPRGQVLRIKLAEGAKGKLAVTRPIDEDFSKAPRMLFEAENLSDKTIKVAWAFQQKDGNFYESIPVDVTPGKWHYGLKVDFTQSNFKTAASQWKNTAEWANRNGVGRLTAMVYDSPAKGTLNIDRVRMEKGASFVRSIPLTSTSGRGVSIADFDGDGVLDLLLCSESGYKLFQNNNNTFVDVTAAVGLTGAGRTATWADIDGDGKLELVCATPALWRFKDGKFIADTKTLPLSGAPHEGVAFFDANGDGKTDLLAAKGDAGLELWINEGATFKNATEAFGLGKALGAGKRNMCIIADADGDGYADILCNQGKGLLLRGDDGKTFKAVANSKIDYTSGQTLGVAFGDYDNDGSFDLFIPQPTKSILLHNKNDGTFVNVTDASGALANCPPNARSAIWGDVNMDGKLDLIVAFADGPAMIFLGDGKGKFAPSPFSLGGFDCANAVAGMALADFDNDGDLDLLVQGEKGGGLIVNETPRGEHVPLKIKPPLKKSPGMLVRLYDANDKPLGIRQPGLISNVGSQEPMEAYFAVTPGKYKIAVLFTDGETRENTVTVPKEGMTWVIEDAKQK